MIFVDFNAILPGFFFYPDPYHDSDPKGPK